MACKPTAIRVSNDHYTGLLCPHGQHAKRPLGVELSGLKWWSQAGMIRGTITVDGYPKDQATFNRVSGYVEQVRCPSLTTLASFT